ncbi:MAG: hypothetical protein WC428_02155 [Candidatus Paceibacterota bacterium]
MKKINIQAVKIGNMINVSIDGKLNKKNCKSADEANTLFKAILKAKENPNEANIKAFKILLSEKLRIATIAGLESDPQTGEIFLCGFNTPIPQALVDVIEDYAKNKYPMDALINFWKLLMINPDKRIREKLFDFIKIHDFSITDAGYMVVYKAVDYKDDEQRDKTFETFISNQVLHVKKDWKCSPKKYAVYKNLENDEYGIAKVEVVSNWDERAKNIEILGNLDELFKAIFENDYPVNDLEHTKSVVYTDIHSHSMIIVLGKPVYMERKECDGDPSLDCSIGLHCGSTDYVNHFANGCDAVLVCYVSPANVISVPSSETSKIRVSEYFPVGVATYESGKIDIIEQKYFEDAYCAYELEELNVMIERVKAEEFPLETAKKAKAESRPMSELKKILETRLIDIE